MAINNEMMIDLWEPGVGKEVIQGCRRTSVLLEAMEWKTGKVCCFILGELPFSGSEARREDVHVSGMDSSVR